MPVHASTYDLAPSKLSTATVIYAVRAAQNELPRVYINSGVTPWSATTTMPVYRIMSTTSTIRTRRWFVLGLDYLNATAMVGIILGM